MEIKKERRITDLPDYNVDYEVEDEFSQAPAIPDLVKSASYNISGKFDNTKFNQKFSADKKKHSENGYVNPYENGYGDMFKGMSSSEQRQLAAGGGREEISVSKPTNLAIPEMRDGRLVQVLPKENPFAASGLGGFEELGLSKISNFSVKIGSSGKGGIDGCDLMEVYGQNNANWEDVVKMDADLYKKFTDETKIETKAQTYNSTREAFNFSDIDVELEKQLAAQKANENKMKNMRKKILNKNDEYFAKEYMGTLKF